MSLEDLKRDQVEAEDPPVPCLSPVTQTTQIESSLVDLMGAMQGQQSGLNFGNLLGMAGQIAAQLSNAMPPAAPSTKKDEVKKDEVKKDEVKKDEVKKDEVKKDEVKKDEEAPVYSAVPTPDFTEIAKMIANLAPAIEAVSKVMPQILPPASTPVVPASTPLPFDLMEILKMATPMLMCLMRKVNSSPTSSSAYSSDHVPKSRPIHPDQLKNMMHLMPQIAETLKQYKCNETEQMVKSKQKKKEQTSMIMSAIVDSLTEAATSAKHMDERHQAICFADKIHAICKVVFGLAYDIGADNDKYLSLKMKLAEEELSKQFINLSRQLSQSGTQKTQTVAANHGCTGC